MNNKLETIIDTQKNIISELQKSRIETLEKTICLYQASEKVQQERLDIKDQHIDYLEEKIKGLLK